MGELPKGLPLSFVFGDNGNRYGINRFYRSWKRAVSRCGVEGVDLYGGTRPERRIKGEIMRPEDEGKIAKFFKSNDPKFTAACDKAGVKTTKRQASKWLMKKGKAYLGTEAVNEMFD